MVQEDYGSRRESCRGTLHPRFTLLPQAKDIHRTSFLPRAANRKIAFVNAANPTSATGRARGGNRYAQISALPRPAQRLRARGDHDGGDARETAAAYEMMLGNTTDKTTLTVMIALLRVRHAGGAPHH